MSESERTGGDGDSALSHPPLNLLSPPLAFEDIAEVLEPLEECGDQEHSTAPPSPSSSSKTKNVSRSPDSSPSYRGTTNAAFEGNLDEKGCSRNSIFVPQPPFTASVQSKVEEKQYTGIKRYQGMLFTLLGSLCFSMVVVIVKVLNNDYNFDAYGSSFWRYTGTVIPTIPILLFAECKFRRKTSYDTERFDSVESSKRSVFDSLWPLNESWKQWIGLLSRGLIGSTSVILRYYALQYLSVGDTAVITYSTPVLVTIMAHFFLGEKCGVIPVIVTITTLVGVVIVTKPPILTGEDSFDTKTLIGTGLALGSLFCSSLIVIITRKIRAVHFALMTLVFGIIGVAQAYIMAKSFGGDLSVPVELEDSLLTLAVAGLSFLGQMSIVLALKFEQAGPVSLIRSCDVIFTFLFQYIIIGLPPDIWSAIGGSIVLAGVVVTGVRKWLKTLPDANKTRQRFACLLR